MTNILSGPTEERRFFVERITHDKGQRTPERNQRGERRPASPPGRREQRPFYLPGPPKSLSLLGCRGWLAQPRSPTQTAAIELLSEVVTWSVLVWFARQRGMKSCVGDGLVFFFRWRGWSRCYYSVLETVGPLAAAASVALPVRNGEYHLWSSPRYGNFLRG